MVRVILVNNSSNNYFSGPLQIIRPGAITNKAGSKSMLLKVTLEIDERITTVLLCLLMYDSSLIDIRN